MGTALPTEADVAAGEPTLLRRNFPLLGLRKGEEPPEFGRKHELGIGAARKNDTSTRIGFGVSRMTWEGHARSEGDQPQLQLNLQTKSPGVVEGRSPLSRRDAVSSDEEEPVRLTGIHQGVRGFCSVLLAGVFAVR